MAEPEIMISPISTPLADKKLTKKLLKLVKKGAQPPRGTPRWHLPCQCVRLRLARQLRRKSICGAE